MRDLTRRTVVGLALLVTGGCGLVTGSDYGEGEEALQRARARWNRAGVQDYQLVVQHLCFCGYTRPVRLTVRFGQVVSQVDAQTGEPVPSYVTTVRDIAGLFDLIREAIELNAHKLDADYDSSYGFPTSIDIDYIRNAVDDELLVKVSEFQPLR